MRVRKVLRILSSASGRTLSCYVFSLRRQSEQWTYLLRYLITYMLTFLKAIFLVALLENQYRLGMLRFYVFDNRFSHFFVIVISSRKLHKNYQMLNKINSHTCLMLSVFIENGQIWPPKKPNIARFNWVWNLHFYEG